METVLAVIWGLELAAGTYLLGMGVLRTGQKKKRIGVRMIVAGTVMMTLFAIFGPDIIVT